MNKKGISVVVASLLIVLITIAAVFIVWNIIKKNIESTGKELTQADCLKIDLSIEKFTDSSVTIVLDKGNVSKLIVSIGNDTDSVEKEFTDVPGIGGKKTYDLGTSVSNYNYAKVIPYIGSGENMIQCVAVEKKK